MPGKKDPSVRRRRNVAATRATLSTVHNVQAPELPEHPWHPMAREWWASVWASPMATEFVEADHPALARLARLVDDFWTAENPTARAKLSAEIRLQQAAFGLTPYDRRRLEWTIEQSEDAQDRGRKRRAGSATPKAASAADDPRNVLRFPNGAP